MLKDVKEKKCKATEKKQDVRSSSWCVMKRE